MELFQSFQYEVTVKIIPFNFILTIIRKTNMLNCIIFVNQVRKLGFKFLNCTQAESGYDKVNSNLLAIV